MLRRFSGAARAMSRNFATTQTIENEELILRHTILSRDHLTPEIGLRLITPETGLWHDNGHNSSKIFDQDPFWAIHWPGGQAIARFLLDHPEIVRKKRVFDLGCGGGAIAIAAALSGARYIMANDVDPLALVATEINAGFNFVSSQIQVCAKDYLNNSFELDDFDILLVGDMYFDEYIGQAVGQLARRFLVSGDQGSKSVYIGDPGRWFLTEHRPENMLCRAKFELPQNVKRENSGLSQGYVYEVVVE